MDISDYTRIVLDKIQKFELENATKIICYLLLHDLGEQELAKLVLCSDHMIREITFKAKTELQNLTTVDVYTALVNDYAQNGFLHNAFDLVEDMKSVTNCRPDIYTYSILLNSCMKHRRFDLIERILAEMSYLGIESNNVIYNTIIDGYGKAGMFEQMEYSLKNVIEIGNCQPDVFTLNSLVGVYGNSGQIEKMEKWYEEFLLMGIKSDVKTFNIMIKSYGKAGLYDKMKFVMDFMEKRFFSPTILTYNSIIEVFGKSGDIEKMDRYLKKMKHIGVKPNSITYCSLVSAYSKAGCLEKVEPQTNIILV